MDLGSVVGFIAIATCLMVGIGSNISTMADLPSLIIVAGGALATLLVSFPLREIVRVPLLAISYVFVPPRQMSAQLDRDVKLGIEIYQKAEVYLQAWGWVGVMIGLIIMARYGVLTDPGERLGNGLSICFLTAFYGVALAYLVCRPIRTKLSRHLDRLQNG